MMGCAVLVLPLPFLSRDTLSYYPYPLLTWPVFDPFIGAVLLIWLLPLTANLLVRQLTRQSMP